VTALGPHSSSSFTRGALEGGDPIRIKTGVFEKKMKDNEVTKSNSKTTN
jgi:hypothetical protein